MSTHKQIDRICCGVLLLVLLLTIAFMNAGTLGVQAVSSALGYESRLFDTSMVHTIEIEMEDWDSFLEGCTDEEYVSCSLVIDQEACKNVAIRAKGNTSLTSVASYGNNRYSFKVEFDHYDQSNTYYGLDKLCLNNIIQDNTYMKDYVTYQMMSGFGVDSPLCSYVYLTVNGEDFGLYLAVEGVEESFLERNYGRDYGELYKPDSMSMGGGRGNGAGFDPGILEDAGTWPGNPGNDEEGMGAPGEGMPPEGMETGKGPGGPGGMSMGSDDVSLIYTDDEYDSYSNIFDNAKTEISDSDKERLIDALKKLNEGKNIDTVVDIEEVIRYFTVHNFVCNFDSYTGSMIHNYYLYEKDGQLSMIPWDYNLAFGGFESGTDAEGLVNYPIDSPVSGGTVESRPMLAWIFADEEYTKLYHQYFAEFIEQYFTSGEFEQMIDAVSEMIAPYVEKDPTKFCTYEEFQEGVSTLKSFCVLRAESIEGQLDGTISSTEAAGPAVSEEPQTEDTEAVEAASLSVEAMGIMGNTFGPGNGSGNDPGKFMREGFMSKAESAAEDSSRGNQSRPEEIQSGIEPPEMDFDGEAMPGGAVPDMEKPQDMNTMAKTGYQTNISGRTIGNTWILAAASAALLLAGIFFACRYKRY
nr:CotH kinase family protein [uncultured Schaedlerella sp.]